MSDEGPKPSKEWSYPTHDELQAWASAKPASYFSLPAMLRQSMPLYMFSRYCKEEAPANAASCMFVEDVCRYRRLYGDVARKTQSDYMMDLYTGGGEVAVVDMVESELERRPKKDVSEEEAKSELSPAH
jgi:hypothetical protein